MDSFLDYQNEENMSLFTDFYELTMCASYFDNKKFEPATFDLFVRRLHENRSYLLFAGLEQVLLYLKTVKFTDAHLAYLAKQGCDQQSSPLELLSRLKEDILILIESLPLERSHGV